MAKINEEVLDEIIDNIRKHYGWDSSGAHAYLVGMLWALASDKNKQKVLEISQKLANED